MWVQGVVAISIAYSLLRCLHGLRTFLTGSVLDEQEVKMAEGVENEASVGSTLSSAGAAVKDSIVGSVHGLNDIGTEIVSLVSHTVSNTVRQTGDVATTAVTVAGEVVKGTMKTTEAVGTGLIGSSTTVGQSLVTGVRDVGSEVLALGRQAVQGTVTGVAEIGAEVGTVANNAMRGMVEITRETGGNVGAAARDAATGTLAAASEISHQAVKAVTGVLVDVVDGVKEVLGAVLPRPASPSATASQESPTTQGAVTEPRLLSGYQTTSGPEL